jgi:hypothetical protein
MVRVTKCTNVLIGDRLSVHHNKFSKTSCREIDRHPTFQIDTWFAVSLCTRSVCMLQPVISFFKKLFLPRNLKNGNTHRWPTWRYRLLQQLTRKLQKQLAVSYRQSLLCWNDIKKQVLIVMPPENILGIHLSFLFPPLQKISKIWSIARLTEFKL